MGLVIRKKFDWQEDLDNFDWKSILRKSGVYGKYKICLKLTLKGYLRNIFGVNKS